MKGALDPAAADQDFADVLRAGLPFFPGKLATLLTRTGEFSGERFAMGEQGLRTVLYSTHPIINTDIIRERVDILPLSKTYVLAESKEERVGRALSHGLGMAALEDSLFDTATQSLLAGKELVVRSRIAEQMGWSTRNV